MRRLTHIATTLALIASAAWALPDYKAICADMPDLSGWKADECTGMKMTNPMMGGEVVTATREYTKGDASLTASVVTGMQAMMMWGPYSSGMTMENDEMLMKIQKIDGFDVGINYDKKAHSGVVVVQLTQNALLAFNFENMDWQAALEEAKKFDWKKLRSLFE